MRHLYLILVMYKKVNHLYMTNASCIISMYDN
jgi:hypothetical protein